MELSSYLFLEDVAVLKGSSLLFSEKLGAYSAESVEGTSLALQSVDDIHGGDSFPHGMLCVGDCIPDYLQEDLQDTAGLLADGSLFTPPRQIAGLVIPWMLSRSTFLWRLTPHFPRPLPPLPHPDIVTDTVDEQSESDGPLQKTRAYNWKAQEYLWCGLGSKSLGSKVGCSTLVTWYPR